MRLPSECQYAAGLHSSTAGQANKDRVRPEAAPEASMHVHPKGSPNLQPEPLCTADCRTSRHLPLDGVEEVNELELTLQRQLCRKLSSLQRQPQDQKSSQSCAVNQTPDEALQMADAPATSPFISAEALASAAAMQHLQAAHYASTSSHAALKDASPGCLLASQMADAASTPQACRQSSGASASQVASEVGQASMAAHECDSWVLPMLFSTDHFQPLYGEPLPDGGVGMQEDYLQCADSTIQETVQLMMRSSEYLSASVLLSTKTLMNISQNAAMLIKHVRQHLAALHIALIYLEELTKRLLHNLWPKEGPLKMPQDPAQQPKWLTQPSRGVPPAAWKVITQQLITRFSKSVEKEAGLYLQLVQDYIAARKDMVSRLGEMLELLRQFQGLILDRKSELENARAEAAAEALLEADEAEKAATARRQQKARRKQQSQNPASSNLDASEPGLMATQGKAAWNTTALSRCSTCMVLRCFTSTLYDVRLHYLDEYESQTKGINCMSSLSTLRCRGKRFPIPAASFNILSLPHELNLISA